MNPFTLDIEKFRGKILDSDLARPNLFRVQINPAIIAKVVLDKNTKLFSSSISPLDVVSSIGNVIGSVKHLASSHSLDKGLLCKAVNLPGTGIETEQSFSTKPFKTLPKFNTFAPVTLTFYAEEKQLTRIFFEDWQNMVIDRQTGLVGFYDEYTTGIFVYNYDRKGKPTSLTYFHECYPTNVGQQSLNWDSNNEVMTYDVEFTYRWSTTTDANPALILDMISKEL